jgi:hypothetical protein
MIDYLLGENQLHFKFYLKAFAEKIFEANRLFCEVINLSVKEFEKTLFIAVTHRNFFSGNGYNFIAKRLYVMQ